MMVVTSIYDFNILVSVKLTRVTELKCAYNKAP